MGIAGDIVIIVIAALLGGLIAQVLRHLDVPMDLIQQYTDEVREELYRPLYKDWQKDERLRVKGKGNKGGTPDKPLLKGVQICVHALLKIPSPRWLGIFSQGIFPEPENLRTGSNFFLCSIKTI